MHPPVSRRRVPARLAWLLLGAALAQACGGGGSTTGPTAVARVELPVRGIRATQLPATCTSGILTATGPGPSQSVPLPPLEVTLSLQAGVWTLTATVTCNGQSASGSTTVMAVPPNPVFVSVLIPGVNSTLTVNKVGSGTVTGPGIACGGDCAETYTIGTAVTLTAAPDSGFVFVGWSGGGCSGTGTCTLTITSAPVTVTATFAPPAPGPPAPPPTFPLTVTKNGTGSGTVTSAPAGINCGPTCAASFTSGTVVTLTATPAGGSLFAGWSGGGCSGTGTCTVTVTAAVGVTATFNTAPPATFTLTVTKAGAGSGSVTSAPGGINCGGACSATFASGTVVTLTATPAAGSDFGGWSGGGCSGTGTCTVTMNGNITVTATFVPGPTLTVTIAWPVFPPCCGDSGTVTSSPPGISCTSTTSAGATCTATFPTGTVVTLTATTGGNAAFLGWMGSGCSGTGTCTVTMTAPRSVTAGFYGGGG